MRYFQLERANRPMAGITFERFDVIAGVLFGMYAASQAQEITALLDIAKDPKSGLSEITAEEYSQMQQKKTPAYSASPSSSRPTPPVLQQTPVQLEQAHLKGAGNAVVDPSPAPPNPDDLPPDPNSGVEPVAKPDDIFKTDKVAPPVTVPPRASKKTKEPASES